MYEPDEPHQFEPLRGCLIAVILLGGLGILGWIGAWMIGWVHL